MLRFLTNEQTSTMDVKQFRLHFSFFAETRVTFLQDKWILNPAIWFPVNSSSSLLVSAIFPACVHPFFRCKQIRDLYPEFGRFWEQERERESDTAICNIADIQIYAKKWIFIVIRRLSRHEDDAKIVTIKM